jgi:hypothetical protein
MFAKIKIQNENEMFSLLERGSSLTLLYTRGARRMAEQMLKNTGVHHGTQRLLPDSPQ